MTTEDIIYGKRLTILCYTAIRRGLDDGAVVTVGYVFQAVVDYNREQGIKYNQSQLRKRINRRIAELRDLNMIVVEWLTSDIKKNQYQVIKSIIR